jgi:hypothetical protein
MLPLEMQPCCRAVVRALTLEWAVAMSKLQALEAQPPDAGRGGRAFRAQDAVRAVVGVHKHYV